MAGASRDSVFVGLIPNQWVVLYEKEDFYGNPAFYYHATGAFVEADPANPFGTLIKVQDATIRGTWTDLLTVSGGNTPLVPGGHIQFSTWHSQRFVRVIAKSAGGGRLDATVQIPEDQVLPNYVVDQGGLGACSSYCEALCQGFCQTAAE